MYKAEEHILQCTFHDWC